MSGEHFIAGCIGAIAPEIVRLYQIRLTKKLIRFTKFYFLISLLYILLGGYVASIFPGITGAFWAMCIGVGLVTTLNTMGKFANILSMRIKTRAYNICDIDSSTDLKDIGDNTKKIDISVSKRDSRPLGTIWDYIRML